MDNPGKTYPRALLACVFLVILCNALPVLVGTGSAAVAAAAAEASDSGSIGEVRWSLWKDGYFADVATAIAGRWLGVWVVLAAAAANIGLFEAEMSSDALQLMGMVRLTSRGDECVSVPLGCVLAISVRTIFCGYGSNAVVVFCAPTL